MQWYIHCDTRHKLINTLGLGYLPSVTAVVGILLYTHVLIWVKHLVGGGRVRTLSAISHATVPTDQEKRGALLPGPGVQTLGKSMATWMPQKTWRTMGVLTEVLVIFTWKIKIKRLPCGYFKRYIIFLQRFSFQFWNLYGWFIIALKIT